MSALYLALVAGLAACGASAADQASAPAGGCGDASCFNTDAGADGPSSDVATDIGSGDAQDASPTVNALCGAGCIPDSPFACGAGGIGPVTDASTQDSALPDSDAAEEHDADVTDASYKPGQKAAPFSPSEVRHPTDPSSPGPAPNGPTAAACQVTAGPDGDPVPVCMEAGSGVENDPCVESTDCAPGYACVGDATTGVCLAYCCVDAEGCAEGTWCAERTSRDALTKSPSVTLNLPVCVVGDDCKPLPDVGGSNGCPPDLACTIVRNDGTRACLPPGTLGEGDTCGAEDQRCAEGFVCSRSSMTCLRLCHIGSDDCGGGVCQAGSTGFPDDIGICVGGNRD